MFSIMIKYSKYVMYIFFFLAIFFSVQANSEVKDYRDRIPNDSTQSSTYIDKANKLLQNHNTDSALFFAKKALILQIKMYGENTKKVANTNTLIGRIYWLKNEYDRSLFYLQSSLRIKKSIYGESNIYVANAHSVIGIVLWSKGQYDLAFEQYKEALRISIDVLGDSHPKIAGYHQNIGILLTGKGAYGLALEYLNQALTLTDDADYLPKANVLQSIGIAYRKQKKNDMALQYLFMALDVINKSETQNFKLEADYYNSIGMVFLESNDNKQALEYFEKSLAVYRDLFGEIHSGTAVIIHNMGIAVNKYSEKLRLLNKALAIRLKNYGSIHPEVADSYNELAITEYNKGYFKKAIDYYQKAIDANQWNINTSTPESGILNCLDCVSIIESLNGKSISFRVLYKNNGNLTYLDSAWSNFEACDAIVYQIQKQYLNHDDKVEFRSLVSEINKNAIEIVEEFQETGVHAPSLDKAFHLSERSRIGMLSQKLQIEQGEKMAGIPDNLLADIKNISIAISNKQSQMLNKSEIKEDKAGSEDKIYSEIFSLNRKHDSIVSHIEQAYPDYYQLKYNTKTATIEEVQTQIIDKDKVLIEYFTGDSSIYIFAITRSNYMLKKVSIDSSFYAHFNQFRNSLLSPKLTKQTPQNFNQYTSSAYNLYNYLLAPIKELIEGKDLIIIPDDHLALLPFEALLTKRMQLKSPDYKQLPYLLKFHTISYANSATTLLHSLQRADVSKSKRAVLAFAPSFDNKLIALAKPDTVRSSLGPLGWTEKEINSLASYFEVDTYLGKLATEKSFKENAGQYNIIHIASHGLIDDQNPMYSKIAFALEETDSINDGYLHTFELYNMQLNAKMAVLSACNTGYGKVQKGEGIMSLGYAFAYAGVPSVIISHWQVDDKSTYLLMNEFYKYLAEGMPKSVALQKAKLALLENENAAYANPYYWGAFVAYGNDEPIETKPNTWVWLLAVLLVISALSLLFFKRAN